MSKLKTFLIALPRILTALIALLIISIDIWTSLSMSGISAQSLIILGSGPLLIAFGSIVSFFIKNKPALWRLETTFGILATFVVGIVGIFTIGIVYIIGGLLCVFLLYIDKIICEALNQKDNR